MLFATLRRVVAKARLERARMLPTLLNALSNPERAGAEPGDPRADVERPELVARELREDLDPAEGGGRVPALAWATDDDLIALYKCLPEPERRAYDLPVVKGVSPVETAAETGLDVESVIQLQRDALRSLRRWLAIVDEHRRRITPCCAPSLRTFYGFGLDSSGLGRRSGS